jgi:hypothetical protein
VRLQLGVVVLEILPDDALPLEVGEAAKRAVLIAIERPAHGLMHSRFESLAQILDHLCGSETGNRHSQKAYVQYPIRGMR